MIRPSLWRAWTRRALARNCMIERWLESSMKSGRLGELVRRARRRRLLLVAVLGEEPVAKQLHVHPGAGAEHAQRELGGAHFEGEDQGRAPRRPRLGRAAASAILSAKEVLPIEGRAARTIISCLWKPKVSRSRSWKPEGTPVISPFFIIIFVMTFIASLVGSFIGFAHSLTRSWVTRKCPARPGRRTRSSPPVKLRQSSTAPVADLIISRSRCSSRTLSMKYWACAVVGMLPLSCQEMA